MYVANYHSNEHGNKLVVVAKEGRRWIHLIAMIKGRVRVLKVPSENAKYLTPAMRGNKPYALSRAVKGFRHYADRRGVTMTPGAKRLLTGV